MIKRSASLDAIRVIGIVAIVAGHVWSNEGIRAGLYTWHVPVFFFLSGYLWKSGRTIAAETRNRTRSIGVPYVFWLVLISVVFIPWSLYRGSFPVTDMWRIIAGGSYIGRPFSAFWFMSALFVAAILFRLLERWIWAVALVAVAGLVVTYIAPEVVASIPLSIGVAIPSMIFMLAGYLLKKYRPRLPLPTLSAVILLAAAVALIVTGLSTPLDMKKADFGTPLLSVIVAVMICTGLVLLAETAVPRLGTRVGSGIILLASCGTMVVLTHAVILWALGTPTEGSVLDFAIALVVPWVAALIVARTRLAPLAIGSPRQTAAREKIAKR